MKTYDVFEHTADIGIHAYGKTLKQLFVNAAEGMFSLVTGGKTHNKAGMNFLVYKKIKAPYFKRRIDCEGPDKEALLIFWLSDLLYGYNTEEILFQDFDIHELTDTKLKAVCYGPNIHDVSEPKIEIKAVTFHKTEIRKHPKEGWEATVIFDI